MPDRVASFDPDALFDQLDQQAGDGLAFWVAYAKYLLENPGTLALADQITFFSTVMSKSTQTPWATWSTPQIAIGAFLTGYTGDNWDYLLSGGNPITGATGNPYIPWPPSGIQPGADDTPSVDQCVYPSDPVEPGQYPDPPHALTWNFWPPALFSTRPVCTDRYTAARVLRLSLAMYMETQAQQFSSGSPAVISAVAPDSPGRPVVDPRNPAPVSPSGSTASNAITAALSICQTLAFALPAPYGPIGAAALQLLGFFCSSSSSSGLADLLQAIDADIKAYFAKELFDQDLSDITACSDYLNTTLQMMTDLSWEAWSDPNWTQQLINQTSPEDGYAFHATETIWDLHLTTRWEVGALDAWVAGQSLILMCYKLLLQTYALAEAKARLAGDQATMLAQRMLWWENFDLLRLAVTNKSEATYRLIADQIDDRLARVGVPFENTWEEPPPGIPGPGSQPVMAPGDEWADYALDGISYGDAYNNQPNYNDQIQLYFKGGTDVPTPSPPPLPASMQIDEIRHLHLAYLVGTSDWDGPFLGLGPALDQNYAGAIQAIEQWVEQLATWTAAVPPDAPTTPPGIAFAAGTGKAWPSGAKVAYAYSLGNARGASGPQLSDASGPATNWTDTAPTTAGSYPTLTFDVATDQHFGGLSRYVYRQLYLPGQANPLLECIGAMDVTVASWTDPYLFPAPTQPARRRGVLGRLLSALGRHRPKP